MNLFLVLASLTITSCQWSHPSPRPAWKEKKLNDNHSGCHSYWLLRAQYSQTLTMSMNLDIPANNSCCNSHTCIYCIEPNQVQVAALSLTQSKSSTNCIYLCTSIIIYKHSIKPSVSIESCLVCHAKQQNHNASRHHLQWQVILNYIIVQLPHEDAHMKP